MSSTGELVLGVVGDKKEVKGDDTSTISSSFDSPTSPVSSSSPPLVSPSSPPLVSPSSPPLVSPSSPPLVSSSRSTSPVSSSRSTSLVSSSRSTSPVSSSRSTSPVSPSRSTPPVSPSRSTPPVNPSNPPPVSPSRSTPPVNPSSPPPVSPSRSTSPPHLLLPSSDPLVDTTNIPFSSTSVLHSTFNLRLIPGIIDTENKFDATQYNFIVAIIGDVIRESTGYPLMLPNIAHMFCSLRGMDFDNTNPNLIFIIHCSDTSRDYYGSDIDSQVLELEQVLNIHVNVVVYYAGLEPVGYIYANAVIVNNNTQNWKLSYIYEDTYVLFHQETFDFTKLINYIGDIIITHNGEKQTYNLIPCTIWILNYYTFCCGKKLNITSFVINIPAIQGKLLLDLNLHDNDTIKKIYSLANNPDLYKNTHMGNILNSINRINHTYIMTLLGKFESGDYAPLLNTHIEYINNKIALIEQ